jgi:hypothetical protein
MNLSGKSGVEVSFDVKTVRGLIRVWVSMIVLEKEKSRFPSGMTDKKARATTETRATTEERAKAQTSANADFLIWLGLWCRRFLL